MVDKRGKGEYCLISVFNHHRSLLLEQVGSLNEKIEIANNQYSSKSLQSEKMKHSIKIITSNAKIKEHELEILENGLVDAAESLRVFAQGCESFREMCTDMVDRVSVKIAEMDDPNEIQHYLEVNIRELLAAFSITE